jgi:hypothetical protein
MKKGIKKCGPKVARTVAEKFFKKSLVCKIVPIYICSRLTARAHNSVGSEWLPYKQQVGGSSPSVPTKARFTYVSRAFLFSKKNLRSVHPGTQMHADSTDFPQIFKIGLSQKQN